MCRSVGGMSRLLRTLAVVSLLLLATTGTAAAIPAGSTALVDRPTGFGALPFDGVNFAAAGTHAISSDGRFVVFTSASDVLLDGDDDSGFHVYRLDREGGRIEQVDTTAAGAQAEPPSFTGGASISADGRFVAFTTGASNLVPGARTFGLYVKDMNTGEVELASRATGVDGAP